VMSLRQLLDRYAKDVTPTKKESKRKHDQRAARVFLAYFADRASVGEKERGPERHPSTLDREDWSGFVAARRAGTIRGWERPCRNNQIRLDLKFLLSVLHWASGADEGAPHFLARNPWRWERRRAQKMVMPKEKDPRRPGISEEQHERVLAHSPNWRFALVAVLCRATMHRMNSVRQLRKVDVDLDAGRVRWRGEFDKTGRELVTPLPPEAVEAIREAAPDVLSPWLIPSDTDPSRPVSRSVLNDWMQKVKERAGVDVDRLGFHAYKRSGIRTKEFRALPPKVQEQLTGTTHAMLRAVYDEVPFEELAEAMESLHKARRRA
jgi:integrase